MQIAKVSLVSIIITLLVACSSTGYVTKANLNVPRVVKVQAGTHPEVAPYLPEFVDALRSVGFENQIRVRSQLSTKNLL